MDVNDNIDDGNNANNRNNNDHNLNLSFMILVGIPWLRQLRINQKIKLKFTLITLYGNVLLKEQIKSVV